MPLSSRRAILTCLTLAVLTPRAANAHAILEASEPKPGGSVPAGPLALKLRFNSRIDRARSRLSLTRPDRTKSTVPIDQDGAPDVLTAAVIVQPGAHVLRWQVLAVDGHITRGDVAFTVADR